MQMLRRPAIRNMAVLACAVLLLAPPALGANARLATPREKNLVESIHFGSFYLPQVVSVGKKLLALWRAPGQSGATRTVAVSKDGGKTFANAKTARIPVLSQILAVASDSEGNVYFAGTTALANQIAIVRSDSKLKQFSAPTLVESSNNVVSIDLAVTPDDTIYLAYQTRFALNLGGGVSGFADQTLWTTSTDHGETFAEGAVTNSRPGSTSDLAPSLVVGADGVVWLLGVRDVTKDRALAPESYNGGQLIALRLDIPDSEPVTIPRAVDSTSEPSRILGYVATDGALCVSWAELTPGLENQVQSVYFLRMAPDQPATPPLAPLARVGTPYDHHMARTADGQVVILLHGQGYDANQPQPAIIGFASDDDGVTFGALKNVTNSPAAILGLNIATDGKKVYGLWTDTRLVRFSAFVAKPPKN